MRVVWETRLTRVVLFSGLGFIKSGSRCLKNRTGKAASLECHISIRFMSIRYAAVLAVTASIPVR